MNRVAARRITRRKRFWSGVALGAASGVVAGMAGLYWSSQAGLLVISVGEVPVLVDTWYWMQDNIRLSIIPFTGVLVWYLYTLRALSQELSASDPVTETVRKHDRRSELQSVLFFGVGVIWTAIGLRSALIEALDGLDAELAAELGAFSVLQRLVNGGILLALTTTIVGGIGGYLMRLVKSFVVGPRLDLYYESLTDAETRLVLDRLDAIEAAVRARTTFGSSRGAGDAA